MCSACCRRAQAGKANETNGQLSYQQQKQQQRWQRLTKGQWGRCDLLWLPTLFGTLRQPQQEMVQHEGN